VLVAGGAAAFLAACGGGDDKPATTRTEATAAAGSGSPAAGAATTAAEQPKLGGTLRYPFAGISSGDPPTIFPYENLTYLAQNSAAPHYSRLLRGASGPGIASTDNTKLEGDLAAGLPEQPDDVTYVFKLRPSIKFHDKPPLNGREATAQDILKTWEAFQKISQNASSYTDVVAKLEAPDNKTIKITLKDPSAPFLIVHASSAEGFWFVPVETIENNQAQTDPVGTGPFVFRQWERGVAMRWDRHPNYYDSPAPHVARVEASLNNDPQRILTALQAGQFDFSGLSSNLYDEAKRKLDPKGKEFFDLPQGIGGFYFNFDNKPWGDKRVRQALSMALDRDGYLKIQDPTGKGTYSSHIAPAHSPFFMSPRENAADFGPNAKYFKKDIAEAKKLLAAAGYPDGLSFRLTANVDRYGAQAKQAWELFANTITEAGFKPELVFQEYGAYIQSTYLGKIAEGCACGPLHGNMRDPDQLVFSSYWSKSARHQWGGTPIAEMTDLDARFLKQRRILNLQERVKEVQELQRVMAESMLVVPYHATPGFFWTQPWVQNFHYKTSYAIHAETYAKVWFTEDRIKKG
jgi:peptide/nickel transport system substrate-binding protein